MPRVPATKLPCLQRLQDQNKPDMQQCSQHGRVSVSKYLQMTNYRQPLAGEAVYSNFCASVQKQAASGRIKKNAALQVAPLRTMHVTKALLIAQSYKAIRSVRRPVCVGSVPER
eukprot:5192411-Pleurochrysis_carterae.AAC.4